MKSSTRDEAEGKLHQVKGKVKEIAGKANMNPDFFVSLLSTISIGNKRRSEQRTGAIATQGLVKHLGLQL